LLKSEDLKIILKGIVVLIIASFLANCSRDDKMNLPPEGYQLDILYGEVENYTGNDGQWLNVYL
jgi:hypothetical protein